MNDKESSYLSGKLLIAMPQMADPRFHRAVIFVCVHDAHGAMGLVVNQGLPGLSARQLFDQLQIRGLSDADAKALDMPIHSGGPVESARGFLLHSADFRRPETIMIGDDYGVTGTIDALIEIARGRGPKHSLFLLGYSGWGAGQMEKELQENSWLVADPNADLIFNVQTNDKWGKALAHLGIDPVMLSGHAGRA